MTVVSRITSGLGNQMFQYACGLHVSSQFRAHLKLDTSWFDYHQRHAVKRAFRLGLLRISGRQEYTSGPARPLLGLLSHNKPKIRRYSDLVLRVFGIRIRSERKQYHIQPGLLAPPEENFDILLSGYWQTHDHFQSVRDRLIQEFVPVKPLSDGAAHILKRIKTTESIFVHVRRGDYANFSSAMLSPAYYREAAHAIKSAGVHSPAWFVFSEDIPWCKEHLRFLANAQIVDYLSDDRDVEDMALMAACRGGILANSSFSWWGGALGEDLERPVICPRFWWATPESDYPDLRLPAWTPLGIV